MTSPNRNEPCPCGSGKRYKRCCLLDDGTARARARAARRRRLIDRLASYEVILPDGPATWSPEPPA